MVHKNLSIQKYGLQMFLKIYCNTNTDLIQHNILTLLCERQNKI